MNHVDRFAEHVYEEFKVLCFVATVENSLNLTFYIRKVLPEVNEPAIPLFVSMNFQSEFHRSSANDRGLECAQVVVHQRKLGKILPERVLEYFSWNDKHFFPYMNSINLIGEDR